MDALARIACALLASSPPMIAAIIGVAAVFWRKMPQAAVQAHDKATIELARHAAIVGTATRVMQGLVSGLPVWAVAAGQGRTLPPAIPGR